VENDANAAALAETLWGAARGYSTLFYATIGTGVGSGIVLDGKIFHGKNGAAAEAGHATIDYRSETICNCGNVGCIEALASGTGMARLARRLLRDYPGSVLKEPLTAEDIAAAAAANDALALRILDETAVMLGAWLGSAISILAGSHESESPCSAGCGPSSRHAPSTDSAPARRSFQRNWAST
jgi:glucokinase